MIGDDTEELDPEKNAFIDPTVTQTNKPTDDFCR